MGGVEKNLSGGRMEGISLVVAENGSARVLRCES